MYSFTNITKFRKYKNYVVVKDGLTIETKIIGYKSQGESILIFIRSDNAIAFSALIDCYETSSLNKVSEILDRYNIKTLDFLCWTHPDLDHSKGLKRIIENYVDQHTQIWIPEGVDDYEIECSQEVKELFSNLKKSVIDSKSEYSVYSASDIKDMLCYNSFCFVKGVNEYPLEIIAYAPNSKMIRKQHYLEKFIKNDRSIFCVLSLGEARIFLTGDIENQTIDLLPYGIIDSHAHILKIPHHGSDTSTNMLNICSDGFDVACSTVYRIGRSNLPLQGVIQQYSSIGNCVYCTGKDEAENDQYGMVSIVTNIFDNTYDIISEGNAVRISQ